MTDLHIRPEVADRLGFYVYLYVDPRDGKAFYVGKGQGSRALAHLSASAESRKMARLRELAEAGLEPRIDILAHALRDEETAFRIEAAVIDLLGFDDLTNETRGWRSVQSGRLPLSALTFYYAAKPVEVSIPALLIRINRLYRHDMTSVELYEATRFSGSTLLMAGPTAGRDAAAGAGETPALRSWDFGSNRIRGWSDPSRRPLG